MPKADLASAAEADVFTRAHALARGHTDGHIRARLHSGDWVTVAPGLYALAAGWAAAIGDPAAEARLRARAWQLRYPDAVASHETAAAIHGLVVPPSPPGVWLTRPPSWGRAARWQQGVHLAAAGLPRRHVVVAGGARVTSVDRTLIDLARRLPYVDGVVMTDAALHGERTHDARLREVLAACRLWPGGGRAARVIEFAEPLTESPLESRSRVFFEARGMEPPEVQVRIGPDRVDFYWKRHRTIGEADGLLKYRLDGLQPRPDALIVEKLRQERLEDMGLRVVRWTWRQLHHDPDGLEARIRRAWQWAAAA